MDRFKNKYRIASARAPFWDYGCNAMYFVTICTKNRICWFGDIQTNTDTLPYVSLSEIGKIVQSEWLKTLDMRPDMNLWMGEYVVMPNHFHAIIGIGTNEYNAGRDAMHCVSTNTPNTIVSKNQFGPQSKNLASIIRGFKIGVTKNARNINPNFGWQSRYHDHIIRNYKSFQKISEYIINNPSKWCDDKIIQ